MPSWLPWRRRSADQAVPEAAEPPADAAAEPAAPTVPVADPDTTDDDAFWDLESLPEDPDGASEVFFISRPGAHTRGRRA